MTFLVSPPLPPRFDEILSFDLATKIKKRKKGKKREKGMKRRLQRRLIIVSIDTDPRDACFPRGNPTRNSTNVGAKFRL